MKTEQAALEFLAKRRIAVTGVSRNPQGHGSNAVYERLRERGYEVFAVNPSGEQVCGDPSYPRIADIPGGVEAVVIGTSPANAGDGVRQAIDAGVKYVWMHRAFGAGSVAEEAVREGRDKGLTVIDGGCPLMFGATSDGGHRFMCKLLTLTGKVPRNV